MALSSAQKMKILRILEYPLGTLTTGNMDYSNYVVYKLAAVDSNANAQTEVEALLAQIATADAQLTAKLAQAGVKRIDDIEFFQDAHKVLRSEKYRLIDNLADLLGLPCCSDRSGQVIV